MRKKSGYQNTVRIIAGKFRGRKITFPDALGLRPTGDRLRETVFNWLMPYVIDSHVLDLFAGSGVFAFEALSRGAKSAIAVDQHPNVVAHIQHIANILQVTSFEVKLAAFPNISISPSAPINLIFVDPPFHCGLISKVITWIEQQSFIASPCYIYFEYEKELTDFYIPSHWQLLKAKMLSNVSCALYLRNFSQPSE